VTDEASPAKASVERDALELVHHHPGRLRVRANALRAEEDESRATAVAARVSHGMAAVPGIARLTHNARTGSLLIEYEPGLVEPDAIIARIAQLAELLSPFDPSVHRANPGSPATIAIEATREVNAVVYELTGWRTDLRFLAPAALAALGVYSFAFNKKEPRLPRWDNLLYWSYNIFTALHQREIRQNEITPAAKARTKEPPEGEEP
jgi:hypothetical protein